MESTSTISLLSITNTEEKTSSIMKHSCRKVWRVICSKIQTCKFVIPIMQSYNSYCLGMQVSISRHLACIVKLTTVLTASFNYDLLILEVLILLLRHAYFKIYTINIPTSLCLKHICNTWTLRLLLIKLRNVYSENVVC